MKVSRLNRIFIMDVVIISLLIAIAFILPSHVFAHGYGHGYVNVQDHLITLGESYFKIDDGEENGTFTLEAGRMYMIVLKNEGKFRHEIRFGRDLLHDEQIYNEDLIGYGSESRGAHGSFSVMLRPGESATISLVIPTNRVGEWEIGCFMPGHYSFGQHAKLIVTTPSQQENNRIQH